MAAPLHKTAFHSRNEVAESSDLTGCEVLYSRGQGGRSRWLLL